MTFTTRQRAYAAFAAICLLWGTTYLGIKIALETLPPFIIGGMRFTLAGAVLAIVLRLSGRPWPSVRSAPIFLTTGTLLLGFGNGGVVWAEQFMASGLVAVLVASTPFWLVGLESIMAGGEALRARTVAGLLVGFSGIVLLVWPDLIEALTVTSGWGWAGGLVATQLACLGWALGSTFSKRHPGVADPLTSSAFQMLAGGLVLLTVSGTTGEFGHVAWSWRSVLAMTYLFVAGSLVGFVAYTYALTHLSMSVVSLYPYINPIVAVLLGTWILREPISWRIVMAIVVILGGSAIVTRRPGTRSPATASAPDPGAAGSSRTSPAATPALEVERAERCA